MHEWYLGISHIVKDRILGEKLTISQLRAKFLWRIIWLVSFSLFFILIFKIYLWTSFQGLPVNFIQENRYYDRLTDALNQGQLHFLELPASELTKLQDPYDPVQNQLYRASMHDAAYYRGKWYIYFGITPVLILWIPARILGIGMNEPFAVALFCWVGLIAGVGFLSNLSRIAKLKVERWHWLLVIALLGLSNSIPYLLRRPAIYETAISAAYCCSMLALYFLSLSFNSGRFLKRYLVPGSAFLALSVGARPNFILWIVVLFIISALALKNNFSEDSASIDRKIKDQLAIWLPYISIGSLLALYNYLRFGSFTEFGTRYVLAGVHMQKIKQFSMDLFLPNLYFNVWQPLTYNDIFPFIHARPAYPGKLPDGYIGPEPIAGMFWIAPFLLFIGFLYILFGSQRRNYLHKNSWVVSLSVSVMLFVGVIQLFLISVVLPSATMRYLVDFTPSFLLATVLVWFTLNTVLVTRNLKILRVSISLFAVILIIYGCLSNMVIGVTGYFDNFKTANPSGYKQLIKTVGGYKKSSKELLVHISDSRVAIEPIIYFGTSGAADLIFIERDNKRYRLGIDHWFYSSVYSEWQRLESPSNIKITINISDLFLEVNTSSIKLMSPYEPYQPSAAPVLGKNDIGFSTTGKNVTISVKLDN